MKTLSKAIFLIFAFFSPMAAQAQITGLEFLNIAPDAKIGDIIAAIYIYGVGFVALAALIVFTAGGVRYIFAGDRDPSEAKSWMKNAFWGLVLALTSWLILYTINPELVKNIGDLKLPKISTDFSPPQGKVFVCSKEEGGYTSSQACETRCGPLGGTCNLQDTQPTNTNNLPFCARRGIGPEVCQRITVGACSNINGFSFQTLEECSACVEEANRPRGSIANCAN